MCCCRCGHPAETVRGWLRRFAGRVEAVRMVFTRWCRALSPDPVLPGGRVGVGGRDRRDHCGCNRISTRFGIGKVVC
jgi:hypothetical protein